MRRKTWQLIGTPFRPEKFDLMDEVTLGRSVIYYYGSGMYEGIVTTITTRGCVVYGFKGDRFVKWQNIASMNPLPSNPMEGEKR